jgi:hypothetical protein
LLVEEAVEPQLLEVLPGVVVGVAVVAIQIFSMVNPQLPAREAVVVDRAMEVLQK